MLTRNLLISILIILAIIHVLHAIILWLIINFLWIHLLIRLSYLVLIFFLLILRFKSLIIFLNFFIFAFVLWHRNILKLLKTSLRLILWFWMRFAFTPIKFIIINIEHLIIMINNFIYLFDWLFRLPVNFLRFLQIHLLNLI